MRYRLRHRAEELLSALRFSLSARRRERLSRQRETLPVVRGNMRRVIVVEPPDPIFSEAMFILRDDYFQTPGSAGRSCCSRQKTPPGTAWARRRPGSPGGPFSPRPCPSLPWARQRPFWRCGSEA